MKKIDLNSKEANIAQEALQLNNDHFTSTYFYDHFISKLDNSAPLETNLSADELRQLSEWNIRISTFHQNRLDLTAKKQAYFIHFIDHVTDQWVTQTLNSSLFFWKKRSIRKLQAKAKALLSQWDINQDTFREGSAQKSVAKRIQSFETYFKTIRELHFQLGRIPTYDTNLFIPKKEVLKITSQVLSRNWFSSCITGPQNNCTPFTGQKGITGAFQKWSRNLNIALSLNGAQLLTDLPLSIATHEEQFTSAETSTLLNERPPQTDSGTKTVNLFLPAHRHSLIDSMLISTIEPLKHYILFSNPSAFIPMRWLGQKLASLDEFVAVGPWRGNPPLAADIKLLNTLGKDISPNVLNFPHGKVANAGEVLYIHSEFVESVIHGLISQKYDVNIIPISPQARSELLTVPADFRNTSASATIHQPLRHTVVQKLIALQKTYSNDGALYNFNRLLDHFLITLWYEAMTEHKELTLDELLTLAKTVLNIDTDFNWDFQTVESQ